jgi:hypothetical protein
VGELHEPPVNVIACPWPIG